MEIQSTLRSRIAWRVGGTIMAVVVTSFVTIGFLDSDHDPLVLIGLLPAAVGLLMVFGLGRSAWIKAGESTITYLPAIGRAKVFPRSDVKSIIREPTSRGLSTFLFRDQVNRRIVSCEESFARSDMEKLSRFLGVNLIWDFNGYMQAAASLDEIKAQLDPDELAELKGHEETRG